MDARHLLSCVALLLLGLSVAGVAQSRYIGSVEDILGDSALDSHVFTLWCVQANCTGKRTTRTMQLVDSIPLLGVEQGFRYEVSGNTVYWLFKQRGNGTGMPDSTISVVKLPIVGNRLGPGERHEYHVNCSDGICDCEFVRRNGRTMLECSSSGLYVDLQLLEPER